MRTLCLLGLLTTRIMGDVMTKFSLRNLSGESIGLWWLDGGVRLVPQTSIAIRNSSSLEINSYRGHEFVVRRMPVKAPLIEMPYEEDDESILVIGTTNDVVVVDEDLTLTRRDARWTLRRAVLEAADLTVDPADVAPVVAKLFETWYDAWVHESDLREDMARSTPNTTDPVEPPGGWPEHRLTERDIEATFRGVCGAGSPEPSWFFRPTEELSRLRADWSKDDDIEEKECATTNESTLDYVQELYVTATQRDEHPWCGRWARVGECDANPDYMLVSCRSHCALWEAAGRPSMDVDALLTAAKLRDDWIECMASTFEDDASRLKGAVNAEQNAKSEMSEGLRNVTCAETLPLSGGKGPHADLGLDPLAFFDETGREIPATHLLRGSLVGNPASNISLFKGFATSDECDAVVEAARPRLRPATVNEEGDPHALSNSRRAHAANVEPRDLDDLSDPLARLWRRAFNLANFFTGYDLVPYGQEPFSVIYYNGSQPVPDEYRPHCDGSCDGSPHLHGGRVATMLLYCRTPDQGGTTTFTNARSLAAPKPNDAVFFSYFDKDNDIMDSGLTTHSGCPVTDGDKWVVTLWMRKGISLDDSWDQYDPTGARHL